MVTSDIRRLFGQRVRMLRKEHGWTQAVFAERLGLSQSYLADLERGNRNVSLLNIQLIARGFGISISQLFSKL